MTDEENLVMMITTTLSLLLLALASSSPMVQNRMVMKNSTKSSVASTFAEEAIGWSSAVFPVRGNVYPLGYFYVELNIGSPPKPYYLDIDTGSDLTWLQCDNPCISCSDVPHPLYEPNKNGISFCTDPICNSFDQLPVNRRCREQHDQCEYELQYRGHGSSLGFLVRDAFLIPLTNGFDIRPHLAFGCGYDQQFSEEALPFTDGVLGLGKGKSSIVSQLHELGLTRNIIGHCLTAQEEGFLFFGDDLVPSSGVTWIPMSHDSSEQCYSTGPAELVYGKESTGVKGLSIIFDSGSSYTYFNLQAYQGFVSSVKNDLSGKPLERADDDATLSVCFKGIEPFESILDVEEYFKPVMLSFENEEAEDQLEIQPQGYLIISLHGNVCLGILNGTEADLDDLNVIGDISLQDQLVIYDNEKQRIGWSRTNCNRDFGRMTIL